MELNDGLRLLIALGIGIVVGLERERNAEELVDKSKNKYIPIGLRTFSLIALLGGLSGLIFATYIAFSLFISVVAAALLLIYYSFHAWMTRDIGITTEISLLFTFVLGFLIASEALPIQILLAVAVVLLLFLSQKRNIKSVIKKVNRNEINAFVSYAIIALLILPFLPDSSIKIADIPFLARFSYDVGLDPQRLQNIEIINPSKLWTIVALITGLDLLGHFLERTIGQAKGWLLASLAGGFISSTATTLTIANQSKKAKFVNHLVSSAVFSNMASFFQIAIVIGAINSSLLGQSFGVIIALIVSSLAAGLFFYFKNGKDSKKELAKTKEVIKEKQIINLGPALKFAVIFLLVRLLSKISLEFFGSSGFLITTALGAFSGLDAVLINAAEMAGKSINYNLGVWALVLANAVNLITKSVYSFMQGSREFALKFSAAMLLIIIASLIGILLS